MPQVIGNPTTTAKKRSYKNNKKETDETISIIFQNFRRDGFV